MKNILYMSVILIILSGCSLPNLDNLGLPTWTTMMQMYVLNDSYSVTELADNYDAFVAQGDTILVNQTEHEIIDLDFKSDEIEDEDLIELGDIEINDPDPRDINMALIELAPDLQPLHGQTVIVDPFELVDTDKDIDPFDEFEEVLISSGLMHVSITNDTAIWLGNAIDDDPLLLKIKSSYTDEVIIEIEYENDIAPEGGMEEQTVPLAGENFPDNMYISLGGGSRGTDGEEATIDVDAEVQITIDFDDITASYARAPIPEQTIEDEFEIDLDDNIIIYEAYVKENDVYMTLDIINNIELDIIVTIIIEDLTLPNALDNYEWEFTIPANSFLTEEVSLSGAKIGSGEPIEILRTEVHAITIDTGDEVRELYSADAITVNSYIDELHFSYVTGILKPQEQDEMEAVIDFDVDFPNYQGDFILTGYSELELLFETPIPASFEIDMISYGSGGQAVQLVDFANGELPAFDISEGETTIIINSDEYNINEVFSVLPDSISYTINSTVGHETDPFEYHAGDNVNLMIEVLAELDMAANCWMVPQEEDLPKSSTVETADYDQSAHDAFKSASLKLQYRNTTGSELGANILISESDFAEFDEIYTPDLDKVSVIEVPLLHTTNGDEQGEITVTVLQDDLNSFLADSVFVIPKFQLISSSGNPLSGLIDVTASVSVEIEVSDSLLDD
jgi:hypothetical protein